MDTQGGDEAPPELLPNGPHGIESLLPDSAEIHDGQLTIGGCRLDALADEFGTPLYAFDELTVRNSIARLKRAFAGLDARLSFAAKACSTPGVLDIMRQQGLHLDVVSAGEMAAARRAGFRPSQVHMHGNCKTETELQMAVREGVHAVVVDNASELRGLDETCRRQGVTTRVMLRLTLSMEAETHPHLQTSGHASKFGVPHPSAEEHEMVAFLQSNERLRLVGIHTHLGSQITDATLYARAAVELVELARVLQAQGLPVQEVSLGGGWSVAYHPGDAELAPERVAAAIRPVFSTVAPLRPAVEPGRALVARAAIALYRVASVKTGGGKQIVGVDGGMGDNPRPALYGARYSAIAPGRMCEASAHAADIVGRFCESGDVLARDVALPSVAPGDLLCIPVSGAYQLSMASGYNLVPQPAVVMVAEGSARLLTRRATVDDLLQREIFVSS